MNIDIGTVIIQGLIAVAGVSFIGHVLEQEGKYNAEYKKNKINHHKQQLEVRMDKLKSIIKDEDELKLVEELMFLKMSEKFKKKFHYDEQDVFNTLDILINEEILKRMSIKTQ